MGKNIFTTRYIASFFIIVFCLFGVATISRAQETTPAVESTLASQEAYKLIKDAESSMAAIDTRLAQIEQLGTLPTSGAMQVSLSEISSKIQQSRSLYDQAVAAYSTQDYSKAAIMAFRSRQNTVLAALYLDGILNGNLSSLGVSHLELQGMFNDLVRLRDLLKPKVVIGNPTNPDEPTPPTPTPTVPEDTATTTNPNPNPDTTPDVDINPNPDTNPATTTPIVEPDTDPNDIVFPPDIDVPPSPTPVPLPPVPPEVLGDPQVATCVSKNLPACQSQQQTCITKANQTPNRCQAAFTAGITACKRYETRANTYLAKCQSTLTSCLSGASKAKAARCQTQFTSCQADAKVAKARDLNAATSCVTRQTTRKSTCEATYARRLNTLLTRCATTYTTCDTKVKTKCSADNPIKKAPTVAKPAPKVVSVIQSILQSVFKRK